MKGFIATVLATASFFLGTVAIVYTLLAIGSWVWGWDVSEQEEPFLNLARKGFPIAALGAGLFSWFTWKVANGIWPDKRVSC